MPTEGVAEPRQGGRRHSHSLGAVSCPLLWSFTRVKENGLEIQAKAWSQETFKIQEIWGRIWETMDILEQECVMVGPVLYRKSDV